MNLTFAPQAWDDYLFWQQIDAKALGRIHDLIKDIFRNPFSGIGKPEPLKKPLSGFWSRRITSEHRIVYRVVDGAVFILQLRYHYQK
jgi:toxin YoeB